MLRKYDDIDNAASYERLSQEDRDKRNFSMESDSIKSQKNLILQYCQEKEINCKITPVHIDFWK